MVAPGMARAQQTPPPRYVPQPPAYGNQPYAPVPQQAYGAYGGYAMPGYAPQQYPTGAYQQQPPYGQVPQPPPQSQPRIVMPSGYYGDNDEEYQIGVSKEQIEHEAAEQRAGQIQLPASMLPQTQPVQPQPTGAQPFQQPVRTGAAPTPKLPDLNKIYSNVTSDSDAAYQIPPGYDQQDIEDYNTFYSN